MAAALTSVLMLAVMATPALAFHHGFVPADECAPEEAGTPSNNPTARNAIETHNRAQDVPLPPQGTQSRAPGQECPAPQK